MELYTRPLAAIVAWHISARYNEISELVKTRQNAAVSLVVLSSACSDGLVVSPGKGIIRAVDITSADLPNHRKTLDGYVPPAGTITVLVTVASPAIGTHCCVVSCPVPR